MAIDYEVTPEERGLGVVARETWGGRCHCGRRTGTLFSVTERETLTLACSREHAHETHVLGVLRGRVFPNLRYC